MSTPFEAIAALPLESRTPLRWGREALRDPIALLIDHAFLEKKAAVNAMELLTRWPGEWTPGWVETVTSVARDEASHLAQTVRILGRRGGRLERSHKSHYATALRMLVRRGGITELLDRLLVSALIEVRSCERFAILAAVAGDDNHKDKVGDLAVFYHALFSSELGHYKVFLKLAARCATPEVVEARWKQMLIEEARIIAEQKPGPGIHSGVES